MTGPFVAAAVQGQAKTLRSPMQRQGLRKNGSFPEAPAEPGQGLALQGERELTLGCVGSAVAQQPRLSR